MVRDVVAAKYVINRQRLPKPGNLTGPTFSAYKIYLFFDEYLRLYLRLEKETPDLGYLQTHPRVVEMKPTTQNNH